jgi:hypothetical protein
VSSFVTVGVVREFLKLLISIEENQESETVWDVNRNLVSGYGK